MILIDRSIDRPTNQPTNQPIQFNPIQSTHPSIDQSSDDMKQLQGPRTSMGIQLLHHSQVCILLAAFLVQHDLGGHAHAA